MRMSELNISKSQLIQIADNYVWNARNKSIFYDKVEGFTYEELSEKYNLSVVRIKEIVKDCLDRISKHI